MILEELEYSSIGTLIQEPLSYLGIYFQNKALANVVDPFRRCFFSQAVLIDKSSTVISCAYRKKLI